MVNGRHAVFRSGDPGETRARVDRVVDGRSALERTTEDDHDLVAPKRGQAIIGEPVLDGEVGYKQSGVGTCSCR